MESISCEIAEVLISRRVDGELDAADAPLLDSHLQNCGNCRQHADAWLQQSPAIARELCEAWPEPHPAPTRYSPPEDRRWKWFTVGLAASVVIAFVGVTAFLALYGSKARHDVSMIPPAPPPAARVPAPARELTPPATPGNPLPAAVAVPRTEILPLPAAEDAKTPRPLPDTVAPRSLEAERNVTSQTIVLASPGETLPTPPIPGVSMRYSVSNESGCVALLGDPFRGKAVLRLADDRGGISEIAQADVEKLPEPRRGILRRFLVVCDRPSVREQVGAAMKAAENSEK